MKKYKRITLLAILFGLFILPNSVDAIYNGSGAGGVGGAGGGACPTPYTGYCIYNNARHKTIVVRLYRPHKQNGVYVWGNQLGNTIFITSDAHQIYMNCPTSGTTVAAGVTKYTCSGYSVFEVSNFNHWSDAERVLMEVKDGIITDMYPYYKSAMNITEGLFIEKTEPPGIQNEGYRIIIEPIVTAAYNNNNNHGLFTVKEIASLGLMSGQERRYLGVDSGTSWLSTWLYTDVDDIGITKIGTSEAQAKAAANAIGRDNIQAVVANSWTGYGYNIIDIPESWLPPDVCYKVNVSTSPAVCSDKKENIGTFKEVVEEVECDDAQADPNVTEHGRLVDYFAHNNSCKLYCLESAKQIYPGNPTDGPYSVGTHLVWPTNVSKVIEGYSAWVNKFNMTIEGTKTCKFVVTGSNINELRSCVSFISKEHASEIYQFKADADLNWQGTTTDGKGYGAQVGLVVSELERSTSGFPNFSVNSATVEQLRGYLSSTILKPITINYTAHFALPNTYNRYLIKTSNGKKVTSVKPGSGLSYFDVGYGNLYINTKANTKNNQPLKIKTNAVGENTQFWSSASSLEYSCRYNVKSGSGGPPGPGGCPPDSDNYPNVTEEEIMAYMISNNVSREEAIQKNCYQDISCVCPPNSDLPGKVLLIESKFEKNRCTDALIQEQCYYCSCDEDDLNSNLDLTCKVKAEIAIEGGTFNSLCSEFKEQYCNSEITNTSELDACYYCPTPYEDIDITACIARYMKGSGGAYSMVNASSKALAYCMAELCPPGDDDDDDEDDCDPTVEVCDPDDDDDGYCDPSVEICEPGDGGDDDDDLGFACKSPMKASSEENRLAGICIKNGILAGGDPDTVVDSCDKQYCHTSTLNCPHDPSGIDPMSDDFRSCVVVKMDQGLSLSDAKKACDVFCNGKGKIVIYRTISLENPFPSYDADATTSQIGLQSKPFNDGVRGRYPGVNWNSATTVKNKILNNRGYDGSKIYQEAEPLYTFVLTTETIKNIREYNKKQTEGYNDFTLDCKKDNSLACVSNVFVHNKTYGLSSGTCSGSIATAAAFESCVKRRSS